MLKQKISELDNIIRRLDAMTKAKNNIKQYRHFEMFGAIVVSVEYNQITQLWKINSLLTNELTFTFDSLDLAAMEIYECLQEYSLIF